MRTLPLPLSQELGVQRDASALLQLDVEELMRMLGGGYVDEFEPYGYPGPVRIWAVQTDDNLPGLVVYHLAKGDAEVHTRHGELRAFLRGIGVAEEVVVWIRQGQG